MPVRDSSEGRTLAYVNKTKAERVAARNAIRRIEVKKYSWHVTTQLYSTGGQVVREYDLERAVEVNFLLRKFT